MSRLAEGHEPNFDRDRERGKQGELFFESLAESLADGSAEVKTDELWRRHGNVYLEYECLRRGVWQPSGLAATQADFWVEVLPPDVVVAAPVAVVKEAARIAYAEGLRRECRRGSHPTRGVVLPVAQIADRLADAADKLAASRPEGGTVVRSDPTREGARYAQ